MFRRFSVNFAIFSILMDMGSVAFALYASNQFRPWLGEAMQWLPLVRDVNRPFNLPLTLYVLFPVVWVLILTFFDVYDGEKHLWVVDEFTALTLGASLAGIALAGLMYLSYRDTSRLLFVFSVLLAYLFLLLWRVPARAFYLRRQMKQRKAPRVLILGAGPVGREVQTQLQHAPFHVHFVGFLDDDPQKQAQHQDVLGSLDEVRRIVQEQGVDHVILALPLRAYQRMEQVVKSLIDLPVQIWLIPDYFHLALHHAEVKEIAHITMLNLRASALRWYQRLVKRAFDLAVTILLLIPALPIMGVIALAIWLDDGAPVLFRQQRVGENGRLFTMYKFRTMVKNAEALRHLVEQVDANGNLLHKRPDDPRVTRIGRFLRRSSLDELPQLFNVLRGEMSLVGPRPELPYLVEQYQPWQRKRLVVPPGITGWWQVHGRSDKPMHLNTAEDLYYVQNYSFWLDIVILLKTAWVVLRGKGAY
jgi:exopolysaccharide biosynthesis polyprenyl glycosylphosphotransferase